MMQLAIGLVLGSVLGAMAMALIVGEWRNAHSYYDPTGVDAELWREHCDEPLEVDWGFCPHCGAKIEVYE